MISHPFRVLGLIKWFQKMLLKYVEASVDSTNELMKILLSIEMTLKASVNPKHIVYVS